LDEFEHLAIKDAQLKASKNALAAAGENRRKGGKSHDNKGNITKSDHTEADSSQACFWRPN